MGPLKTMVFKCQTSHKPGVAAILLIFMIAGWEVHYVCAGFRGHFVDKHSNTFV